MNDGHDEDRTLDMLFSAGEAERPVPSAAFLERLAADADTALERPRSSKPRVQSPPVFARFKAVFAASGLSGAAALGVWIGFIMPDLVTQVSPFADDVTTLSAFLPGTDLSAIIE
ncbi:MAG: hypothetical protein AAFR73_03645 [Pseudomonadota bacterium]